MSFNDPKPTASIDSGPAEIDSEIDLETFRQDWLNEVQANKNQPHLKSSKKTENPSGENHNKTLNGLETKDFIEETNSVESKEPSTKLPLDPEQRRQLGFDTYKQAIADEKKGQLGEALVKYRRAFKLDPDVDISYRNYFRQLPVTDRQNNEENNMLSTNPFTGAEEEFEFVKHIHLSKDYIPEFNQTTGSTINKIPINWSRLDPMHETINSLLKEDQVYLENDSLTDEFSNKLTISENSDRRILFKPADKAKPCHITRLPDPLLLKILQILIMKDINSIGRFSSSCIKSLFLTRDNSLWKTYGEFLYSKNNALYRDFREQHPAISLKTYITSNYGSQWRFFLIDYPRVRFDGIYISTCTYIRQGMTENTFNQPIHLITYYRYLRFYPDGTCQSLLTNLEPSQVVQKVYPGSKHFKEILPGEYKLLKHHYVEILACGDHRPGVEFQFSLELKSTSRGKHNKLSWIEYGSHSGGEPILYSLKQFKPYFFSKVKSYPYNCNGLLNLQI